MADCGPFKKTKTKTKPNWMGIVILKKAYSGALVKVSVVITIKKNDYNDNSK